MKHLLYLLCAIFSTSSVAQDPQLFDTTWNLHELIIDGTSIVPTNPIHLGELTFIENEGILNVTNQYCESIYVGDIANYNDITSFELFDFVDPFGLGCENDIAFEFLEIHTIFYITAPTSSPNNPFDYNLLTEGGEMSLTITNGEGNTAIYRNIPLSVDTNSISNIKLLYHPDIQQITFSGLQNTFTISIYNLIGQQFTTTTIKDNEPLLINTLKDGIYLASLSQSNGKQQVFKFVKY